MKIKKNIVVLGLIFSSLANAEINTEEYPSPHNMLLSLIVSPYSFSSDYLNKMIIYRKNEADISCNFKNEGKIIFADAEGGSINSFSSFNLPSPGASTKMKDTDYYTKAKGLMKSIKDNHCLDVNLAPIIDLGYGDRSYFHDEIVYQDHMNAFIKANKESGVKITYKHYPPNKYIELASDERQAFNEAKLKWAKQPKDLSTGYSEVEYAKYITGDFTEEASAMMSSIKSIIDKSDLIMLDNNLYKESGFTPYVASNLPKTDDFLNNFDGLVITDDLYQLNIDNINLVNVFENADLYIITSLNDIKLFHKKMLSEIEKDPALIEKLKTKYKKVKDRLK